MKLVCYFSNSRNQLFIKLLLINNILIENQMDDKGKLLIVDDETTFLKILNLMFSKHYEVKTAETGEDALKLLESGYRPEVILSDQRMPGMSGAEFLEKSISFVPNATRVILTGYSTPKDIIPAINQGHAYMYLVKPADEMTLIQAIKIAFDYHNNNKKVKRSAVEMKKALEQLKDKNEELKKLLAENNEMLHQTVQAISGVANYCERFYFNNHTKFVAITAKAFAEELGIAKDRISNVVLASLLHSSVLNSMPIKFILNDPFDLTPDDRTKYLQIFNNSIVTISRIKKINRITGIIQSLWEHHDGSGFPGGMSGNALTHESQIISIVNFYHNNVYRLMYEDFFKLIKNGYVEQSATRTKKRHEEAIKTMYRRATWFDYDIFHHFQDLIKKKAVNTLVPDTNDLKISNIDNIYAEILENCYEKPEEEEIKGSDTITVSQTTGEKMIEREITIAELEPGMLMGQTVLTKNGMLVVKNETVLDAATIKNLKQLDSTGMVPGSVTVMLPVE